MIHLYSHGFTNEDLVDFDLKLSNPSSIAQQQKLELISTRFDIAGKAPEGLVDRRWLRKNVMGLTDEEIKFIEEGRLEDKQADADLEASGGEGGGDLGGGDEGGMLKVSFRGLSHLRTRCRVVADRCRLPRLSRGRGCRGA